MTSIIPGGVDPNALVSGSNLTNAEWESTARQAGFTGDMGGGRAAAYFSSNPTAAAKVKQLRDQLSASKAAPKPITEVVSNQVNNPTLPAAATFTPVIQKVQADELLKAGPGVTLDPTAITTGPYQQVTSGDVQAAQGTAATVDPNAILAGFNQNLGKTTATFTKPAQEMEAAQGQISTNATVQGQLEKLMNFDANNIPAWAKGAAAKAEDIMAARGLGASSLAAGAIVAAIQQSALPIAAQDASTYFQMEVKNLDNRQQANLENTRMRQQNMLTDTSIANATAQFNAASEQQVQQFTTSLVSSIAEQNAARKTAMEQANMAQKNAVSLANEQNKFAAAQFNVTIDKARQEFNATVKNNREQFNSQMQFAIDQSNVAWRRQVNTQNTVGVNAAMQANVQNLFSMSATAQNNLWQQFRDEASWIFSASESAQNRAFNAAMAANNRDYNAQQVAAANSASAKAASDAQKQQMWASLGSLALKMFF